MFDRSTDLSSVSTAPGLAAAHPSGLGGAAAETLQEHGRAAPGSDAPELSVHLRTGLWGNHVGMGWCWWNEANEANEGPGMERFDGT